MVRFAIRTAGRLIAMAIAIVPVTVLLLAVAACRPQQSTNSSPSAASAVADEELRAVSAAWDGAHNAADLEGLMRHYAEDAAAMPYNRPTLEGRMAIEADFRAFFADFTAHHTTTIVALAVANDWAIERGRYELSATPKAGGAPMSETGKHIVIRRKTDGLWKIQWEIWNTDASTLP